MPPFTPSDFGDTIRKMSYPEYINLLKSIELIRSNWYNFLNHVIDATVGLSMDKYPNFPGAGPGSSSLSLIQASAAALSEELFGVIGFTTGNEVRVINSPLGVCIDKRNSANKKYVGIPQSVNPIFLTTSKTYLFIDGGCGSGCVGCAINTSDSPKYFTSSEFTDDPNNYEKIYCSNAASDWYETYDWYEMHDLDDLLCKSLSSVLDMSGDDMTLSKTTSGDPDLASRVHSQFYDNIHAIGPMLALNGYSDPDDLDASFIKSRFCDTANSCEHRSILYASHTRNESATDGLKNIYSIVTSFAQFGTRFLITTTPMKSEWEWAYQIITAIAQLYTYYASYNAPGCNGNCKDISPNCSLAYRGPCSQTAYPICCVGGSACDYYSAFWGGYDANFDCNYQTLGPFCASSTCPNAMDCGNPPHPCPDNPEGCFTGRWVNAYCVNRPSKRESSQSTESPCKDRNIRVGSGNGCISKTMIIPELRQVTRCVSEDPQQGYGGGETNTFVVKSTTCASKKRIEEFNLPPHMMAILNLIDLSEIASKICVHSAIDLMQTFVGTLNTFGDRLYTLPFTLNEEPYHMKLECGVGDDNGNVSFDATAYKIQYLGWGNVRNMCNCAVTTITTSDESGQSVSDKVMSDDINTCEQLASLTCNNQVMNVSLHGQTISFVNA